MPDSRDLTAVAHLVGDPSRLKMLVALLAYGELSVGDLATVAGVSMQTASAHLGKLRQGSLIRRGYGAYGSRHKAFRLAGDDVLRAVEALSVLAPAEPDAPCVSSSHEATVCYGHLGGTLGKALFKALLDQELLEPGATRFGAVYDYRVTAEGAEVLHGFGIDAARLQKQRRTFAGRCQNAHEANAHLSGSLAEALLKELLKHQWVVPDDSRGRTLKLTEAGKDGLASRFSVRL